MQIPRRRIISFLILTLFTILLPLTGCSGGGSFGTTASQETFWNNVLSDTTNKGTGTTRDTLQGSTGIKPFWTYDTNAIGGGGKALVNLWGGNALVQYTDVSFPGRGLPVEIRRTYNSQTAFAGVFGPGWFSLLDTSVRETDNKVTLLDAYGGLFEFTTPQPSGSDTVYTAPPGRNTIFTKKADGTYTEKKKNGTTYFFDAAGRLTRIQHRNANNYLAFIRDSSDLVTSIQEASGRTTTIEYNVKKKRITSITDPQGRTVTYGYQNNLLHRVKDPGGNATLFDYNDLGFLSAITSPKRFSYSLLYDTASRIVEYHDPLYTVNYQYAEGSTTVTDSYGHSLVYSLNQAGNNTSTVDTMGFTTSFLWDSAMNITKVTNAKNQVTDFTYDDRANLLSVANSLYTIRHTYDSSNNLLSTVDGNGKTTAFTYQTTAQDPDGVLQSVTTPLGRTVSFTYNEFDEPVAVSNARNKTTRYSFDQNGNITAVIDAANQSSSMVYNSVGEATSVTDPLSRTTAFTYDENGLVLTVTTPSGAITTHKYDNHGNKTKTIDALGRATRWEFDQDDRMVEVINAKGDHTVYTYANGRLASTKDPAGFTTSMSYDANDRMTGRTNPITTESFTYDPLGNMLTKGTGLGEIQYDYDELNRVVSVNRPRKSTFFGYDNNNNRTSASSTDTDGAKVFTGISYSYGYDDDNRITSKTKKINGVAYEQTSYGYDSNSNLTHLGVTIKKGVPPTPSSVNAGTLSFAFDYAFDDLDRQVSVKNSKNDTYTASYDAVGNMTNIHYPDNTSSARTFDNEDRIIQVTNDHPIATQPHIVYTYAFDLLGNCTSFEKSPSVPYTGGAKRYEYDKLNRLTFDEAEQTKFVYDIAGNKTRDNLLSTGKNINYAYNQAHQLLSRVPGSGLGLPSFAYEYDANGNQSRKNETASGKNLVPANAAEVKQANEQELQFIDGTTRASRAPAGKSALDATTWYTASLVAKSYSPPATIQQQTPPAAPVVSQTDLPGANYIISSGPDPSANFGVDDQVTFYVNGTQIYQSPYEASVLSPFSFSAEPGDEFRVEAWDTCGTAYNLWPVWVHYIPTGTATKLTNGVPVTYTESSGFQFFNQTFILPGSVVCTATLENTTIAPDVIEPGEEAGISGHLSTTGITTATMTWVINLMNDAGAIVQTWSGSGSDISITTNGLDASGFPLPPGGLHVSGSVSDSSGHTASFEPPSELMILPTPPEIKDTRSTFDAANRLRRVQSYGLVSEQPWLVSDERFSYDPDDELFFSEMHKPFSTQSATTPPDGTSYRFVNLLEGYEGGLLLYTNKTSGNVKEGTLTTTSLAHVIEYYTYLNGVKVGITSVPGKGTGKNYYCSYDGQGNVEHVSNRAGTMPYQMYKYTAYGECSSYEGNAGAAMSAYKGYDKGPFGSKCGVRHYDSESGRFISPDPFKGYMGDPQSQHPYMYCRGNPIKYSDPTGTYYTTTNLEKNYDDFRKVVRIVSDAIDKVLSNKKQYSPELVKICKYIKTKSLGSGYKGKYDSPPYPVHRGEVVIGWGKEYSEAAWGFYKKGYNKVFLDSNLLHFKEADYGIYIQISSGTLLHELMHQARNGLGVETLGKEAEESKVRKDVETVLPNSQPGFSPPGSDGKIRF